MLENDKQKKAIIPLETLRDSARWYKSAWTVKGGQVIQSGVPMLASESQAFLGLLKLTNLMGGYNTFKDYLKNNGVKGLSEDFIVKFGQTTVGEELARAAINSLSGPARAEHLKALENENFVQTWKNILSEDENLRRLLLEEYEKLIREDISWEPYSLGDYRREFGNSLYKQFIALTGTFDSIPRIKPEVFIESFGPLWLDRAEYPVEIMIDEAGKMKEIVKAWWTILEDIKPSFIPLPEDAPGAWSSQLESDSAFRLANSITESIKDVEIVLGLPNPSLKRLSVEPKIWIPSLLSWFYLELYCDVINSRAIKATVCGADDCNKLVSPPRKKYCSDGCRNRDSTRRHRKAYETGSAGLQQFKKDYETLNNRVNYIRRSRGENSSDFKRAKREWDKFLRDNERYRNPQSPASARKAYRSGSSGNSTNKSKINKLIIEEDKKKKSRKGGD